MSYALPVQLKLLCCRTLLVAALPSACAVAVEPGFEDTGTGGTSHGGSTGLVGMGGSPSSAGMINNMPKAGSTSGGTGGTASNPFGGTASTGGKAGSGSGGASDGGGGAAGGKAGAGGAGGGSAGSAGSGTGTCACPKTLTWTDNTVMNWITGDCVSTAGKTYLYTGAIAQTYANGQCNPGKQETWCTDSGNDYKFTACN